jgi:hypothetical protein
VVVPRIHTNLKGKPQQQYIGPTGEREPNRVVIGNHHIYTEFEQFTNKAPLAFYDNDKIFFSKGYKKITIKAIFEDPSSLEDFQQYDWKVTDYPAPAGDIDNILNKLTGKYIRDFYRIPIQPNTQVDSPSVQQTTAKDGQATAIN